METSFLQKIGGSLIRGISKNKTTTDVPRANGQSPKAAGAEPDSFEMRNSTCNAPVGTHSRRLMDVDHKLICQFLKSWPGQFVSRKEICRRAGGKGRYRENENWAVPILQRMLEINLVEKDSAGHFRLTEQKSHDQKKGKKRWISPAIKAILHRSGGNFGVIDLDKEVDPADLTPSPEKSLQIQTEDPA